MSYLDDNTDTAPLVIVYSLIVIAFILLIVAAYWLI